MKIIGLTGGIGSGKSIIAEILRKQHRAEIIDTDKIAHELVAPDKPAHMKIVQRFGVSVLNEDDTLNRQRLREIIFGDIGQRQWLEDVLHPDIRDIAGQRAQSSQADLVVIEIPLLKDRSDYPYVSQVWTVEALIEDRIARMAERDDIDQAQAEAIIASQPSEALRRRIADAVIDNHGDVKELAERVMMLAQRLSCPSV